MEAALISIIIPTLNEEAYVSKTIDHLLRAASDPTRIEILVIDAGSSDSTLKSIADYPVKTFAKPAFVLKKYDSLNFGMDRASGEFLIFLDADTLLPKGFDKLVRSTLAKEKVVGGAFEFAFQPADLKLMVVVWLNRIRYRIDRRFYGDQAIFCKADIGREVGGFPENQLMDAAFFCKRLSRRGKLKLIKKPILTSPRRFLENGFWKTFWFDVRVLISFYLKRATNNWKEEYWSFNQGANSIINKK